MFLQVYLGSIPVFGYLNECLESHSTTFVLYGGLEIVRRSLLFINSSVFSDKTRMHFSRMGTVRCSSCLLGGGVCPVGVCLGGCLSRGVSARGCLPTLSEGVSAQGGECLADNPLWTEFLTHACENITFPQLRLWTVKISFNSANCTINSMTFNSTFICSETEREAKFFFGLCHCLLCELQI